MADLDAYTASGGVTNTTKALLECCSFLIHLEGRESSVAAYSGVLGHYLLFMWGLYSKVHVQCTCSHVYLPIALENLWKVEWKLY